MTTFPHFPKHFPGHFGLARSGGGLIPEGETPDAGFVFVFTDTNLQLETSDNLLVQVLEEYANS